MPTVHEPLLLGTAATTAQGRLHREIERSLDALDTRVVALVRPLDPRQRALPGARGGWSIDRILEHLCLTADDYLSVMRAALDRPGAALIDGQWRPTVGGRLLVWSMTSSWRLPAPRTIVPSDTARPAVLEAFQQRNAELRQLLASAAEREWRQISLTSPYARLVRLNLGDAALVLLRHAERHAGQMARIDVTG
jgi:hypothetical protein